jgi:hypothetical protein
MRLGGKACDDAACAECAISGASTPVWFRLLQSNAESLHVLVSCRQRCGIVL